MIKGLFILFIIFFYFYNIRFSFLPIYTYQIAISLLVLYFFLNKNYFYLEKKLYTSFIAYSIIFLYLLFNFSINGFEEVTLVKTWLVFLMKSYIGIYLLSLILKVHDYSFTDMIKLLQFIIFIHACIMLVYFFNIDFKEWIMEYIPQRGGNLDIANSFRSRGIAGSSGASLALFQSFGLLFTVNLILINKLEYKSILYYGCTFIIILGSIMVSGRTGLLMLPMICFYILLLSFKDRKSAKYLIKYFVGFLFIVFIVGIIYFYKMDTLNSDNLLYLKKWLGNEVKILDGKIEIYTLNVLAKQWLFPHDLYSWIIGNTSTWHVSRIKTDIGYLRVLNAIGIVGFITLYSFFLFIFISMVKRLDDQRNKIMIITLGIFLFIAEYKEPFFFKVVVSSVVMMLYFATILLKEKSE